MAYLTRKKVKGHYYYQTVESYRDPETKKVRQRVIKHHGRNRPNSVEWFTPPELVEMAREVLGNIDLDPASNKLAQGWIKAKNYYTQKDDGLCQQWQGKVWCNPPYGNLPKRFLAKGLSEFNVGNMTAGIFLLNRSGAEWYSDMKPEFTAICEVRKRIAFIDAKGIKQKSPRYNNDFLYLGSDSVKFSEVFSSIGTVRVF